MLQGFFEAQVKEAKAAVAEPLQPKIKLKVSSAQDTPAPTPTGPKKIITIHVANSRGSTAASPAPLTAGRAGDSGAPEMAQNGAPAQQSSPAAPNGGPPAVANAAQIEAVKTASAVAASPSPSAVGLQQGPTALQSPAVGPRPNGASAHPVGTPNGVGTPGQVPAAPQNQLSAPVPNNVPRHLGPPKPSYDRKWRSPTKGRFLAGYSPRRGALSANIGYRRRRCTHPKPDCTDSPQHQCGRPIHIRAASPPKACPAIYHSHDPEQPA